MYALARSLLFSLPPEDAHRLAMAALLTLERVPALRNLAARRFVVPTALRTRRWELDFPSPVGLAGGFDKDARVPRALAALGFGFLELGTVTARAQEANPPPNLFRLPDDRALVNRLGFPNDGARAVARRFARDVGRGGAGVPVGFSIGKSRAVAIDPIQPVVDDYVESFRAVREVADFIVVNVSSPNTANLRTLQGESLARSLLGALSEENAAARLPLLLKVSPDLGNDDLDALLTVVRETKLDGVVATNTTTSRSGLVSRPSVVDAVGAGGLSGPPLRARALEMVGRARAALGERATIIGVGGIETGADARAYLERGANLVQLYTGFVYGGPETPMRIARELADARAARS